MLRPLVAPSPRAYSPPPPPGGGTGASSGGYKPPPAPAGASSIGGYKPPKAPSSGKKAHDDPIKRLNTDLGKIQAAIPSMSPGNQQRAQALIANNSQGLRPTAGGDPLNPIEQSIRSRNGFDLGVPVRGAANTAIKQVSRPFQAVASGVGEWNREVETSGKHVNVGPIRIPIGADLGPILQAGRAGWNLQRHDSPSSILAETTAARREQGRLNPGLLTGYNAVARTVPGTRLVTDLAVGAAMDPLTYLTFGTSSLAKQGLNVVADATDAATAARVAREGLDVLSPAERATVEARLAPKALDALERGARGGVGVRLPFSGIETGRTIIPTGDLAETGRELFQRAETAPGIVGAPARGARTVGNVLGDIFKPRSAVARNAEIGGQRLADELYQAEARARGYLHSNVSSNLERRIQAMRAVDLTPEESRLVGRALDIGGQNVALTPRLTEVADRFKQLRQELTDLQVAQGRLQPDALLPPGAVHTESYLPHVRTPEGDTLFGQEIQRRGLSAGNVTGDPFLEARQLRDMPAWEINQRLSQELGRPVEYFHEDPLLAQTARDRSAFGSMARQEYTSELMNLRAPDGSPLVIPMDQLATAPQVGPVTNVVGAGRHEIPLGYREVELRDPLTGDPTRLAVPQEVGDLVERTSRLLNDPTALANVYDKFLNWWKTMATVPLPFGLGFHLRNAESNFILNWMSGIGVEAPDYFKALKMQRAMAKGVKDSGDAFRYLTGADRYLAQQAFEREVLSTGWFGDLGELEQGQKLGRAYTPKTMSPGERLKFMLKRANPLSTQGITSTGGRRAGQWVEENARLAHFLAAERNIGDVDAAAASVRRWLFDYHDVTASEQQIKKLIPFYTWARKSTSAVLETIIRDPRKLAQFNRLKASVAQSAGVDLSSTLVPNYIRTNPTAVPIGQAGQGLVGTVIGAGQPKGTPLIATPDLPINTTAGLVDTGAGLLSAVPGINRVLTPENTGGPGEGIRNLVGMIGGPAGVGKALLEDMAGVNFFSGAPIRDEYVPSPRPFNYVPGLDTMTAKTRNLVNAVWPTGTKIEGLYPNDPRNVDKQARRILSTMTGLPVYPIGLTTQQAEAYRRLEPVARFIATLQAAGTPVG